MLHLFFAVAALAAQAVLPDTPQGRIVADYVSAFNAGDEKTFLAVIESHAPPNAKQRRTPEQRAEAYRQLRSQFSALKVTLVVGVTPTQLILSIPRDDGRESWWVFTFDPDKPDFLKGLEIRNPPEG
jgi:hypothetical protein